MIVTTPRVEVQSPVCRIADNALSTAYIEASSSAVLRTRSFRRMFSRWVRTVSALMRSLVEICLLVSPRASKRTISRCRGVSPWGSAKGGATSDACYQLRGTPDGKFSIDAGAMFACGLDADSQLASRRLTGEPRQYTSEYLPFSASQFFDQRRGMRRRMRKYHHGPVEWSAPGNRRLAF